jgi:hypothetical protein
MDCFASLAMTVIFPGGQTTCCLVKLLSRFLTIPSHQEGRYAIVTFAGRAAVDAEGAKDDSA